MGDQSRFIYVSVVDATGAGAQSGVQLQEPPIQQRLQEGFSGACRASPWSATP